MNHFIFGDVHGDAKCLTRLIAKVREECPEVQIYSVGDLLDRGPDAQGVVQTCINEGVLPLLGNHELWFREWALTGVFDDFALQPIMGGTATLRSYGGGHIDWTAAGLNGEVSKYLLLTVPQSHRDYISNAPLYRRVEVGGRVYRLTHGGINVRDGLGLLGPLRESLNETLACEAIVSIMTGQFLDRMIWVGAKKGNVFNFPDKSIQVFGHTPWRGGAEVNLDDGYIALDTGCGTCPPFRLSGVLLREDGSVKIMTS